MKLKENMKRYDKTENGVKARERERSIAKEYIRRENVYGE